MVLQINVYFCRIEILSQDVETRNSGNSISPPKKATVGMFDWRLFDNSNRTKVVRQPKKLGCLTKIMFDGKLTIVEHKINRTKSER
jgi:hypothetical protein